jgi:hypothetical protein
MGAWLSRDAEAVHLQRLNRRILRSVGGRWGEVDLLIEAMNSQDFVDRQAQAVARGLWSKWHFYDRDPVIVSFFGRKLWQRMRGGDSLAWGWKDPRTTITFPIWARVFPNARWLHVIRNGIDVAISTHRRSLRQERKLRNRVLPFDYNPRTLDFTYSFCLWETYVSFVLQHKDLIPPDRYMEIRYEDLLAEPRRELQRVADIIEFPVEEELLASACLRIDKGRLSNSALAANYRDLIPDLANSPLMQQLGYDYSLTQELANLT